MGVGWCLSTRQETSPSRYKMKILFLCIVTVSSVRGWRWGEHSVLWPLQAEAKAEASVATEAPAAKLQTNKLLRAKKETSCGGGGGRGQPKHKVLFQAEAETEASVDWVHLW